MTNLQDEGLLVAHGLRREHFGPVLRPGSRTTLQRVLYT